MLAKARQILVSELTFAISVTEEEAEQKLDEALPVAIRTVWAIVVAAGSRATGSAEPKQYAALGGPRVARLVRWPPPVGVRRRRPRRATPTGSATPSRSPTSSSPAAPPARSRCGPVWPPCPPTPTSSSSTTPPARWRRPPLFQRGGRRRRAAAPTAPSPASPVTDTVKQVGGDGVVATVDRDGLVAVQTPQAFRAEALAPGPRGRGRGHRRRRPGRGRRRHGWWSWPASRPTARSPRRPTCLQRLHAGAGRPRLRRAPVRRRPGPARWCSAASHFDGRAGPRRPQRRRRRRPRLRRRPPRRRRAGRHRRALPRHRRHWAGADCVAMLAAGRPLVREAGWTAGQRRLHRACSTRPKLAPHAAEMAAAPRRTPSGAA